MTTGTGQHLSLTPAAQPHAQAVSGLLRSYTALPHTRTHSAPFEKRCCETTIARIILTVHLLRSFMVTFL